MCLFSFSYNKRTSIQAHEKTLSRLGLKIFRLKKNVGQIIRRFWIIKRHPYFLDFFLSFLSFLSFLAFLAALAAIFSSTAACAAAKRAMGTRKGEQLT